MGESEGVRDLKGEKVGKWENLSVSEFKSGGF